MFLGPESPVVVKSTILIRSSADQVFRFIVYDFFINYPKWSPEVKDLRQVTEGQVNKGTKGWQVRIDSGHRSESEFVLTEYIQNRRVVFEGVSREVEDKPGALFKCIYEVNEVPLTTPSTRLSFTFELPKVELYMIPFERIIRTAIKDGADATVVNIKRLIESANS